MATIRSITENETSERAKFLLQLAIDRGVADMDLSCLDLNVIVCRGRKPKLLALVETLAMIKDGTIPKKSLEILTEKRKKEGNDE